jgi:hypothetical protein
VVFALQTMIYAAIVRSSVLSEYQPRGAALIYGIVGGTGYLMTDLSIFGMVRYGVVSGFLMWAMLLVLKRLDGVSLLWWPVMVLGFFVPSLGGFAAAG